MRPSPRSAFLELPKRLVVKFYTTSIAKYLQASHIFDSFGLALHHFKSRTEPYTESYERGKELLLIDAINEIRADIGRTSLFFVEDTSLRIEALSTATTDFPGLAVKEWFAGTDFESLNRDLPQELSERRAIVRSDIALHVPGLADPLFFRGETRGVIATSAPDFEENPYYPWLTPTTFNGWLIPDGATRRLGEMSIDESLVYDFRSQSLSALIARLEEFAAVINAPTDCYVVMPPARQSNNQRGLFDNDGPSRTLIVVGATCAGKTTFGQIAAKQGAGYKVIEASNIVRSFARRQDEGLSALEFATRLLKEKGPDIVAQKAIDMFRLRESGDIIITGFRTIEELEAIRRVRPEAKIVLLEASERIRYSRYRQRGRGPVIEYEDFLKYDKNQWAFGLLRVAEDFADIRIVNEGTLLDYENQVSAVLKGTSQYIHGLSLDTRPPYLLSVHRLFRCLSILAAQNRSMTCDEIEEITALQEEQPPANGGGSRYTGKRITHNNVNKILKAAPELAERIELPGERLRYRITESGNAYIRLMNEYAKSHS